MAYVDYIPEPRGTQYSRFPFRGPELVHTVGATAGGGPAPTAPTFEYPPQPHPLIPQYPPANPFCPQCYSPYSRNGICSNCSISVSSLAPGPSLANPPRGVSISTGGMLRGQLPRSPLNGRIQHPLLSGPLVTDPHDSSMDCFMMKDMLQLLQDDGFKDADEAVSVELVPRSLSIAPSTGVSAMHITHLDNIVIPTTASLLSSASALNSATSSVSTSFGDDVIPPPPTNPCQCGEGSVAICIECQDFLCTVCVSAHKQAPSAKDHTIMSTSTSSSRRTTPPSATPSSLILPSPASEALPVFEEEELVACSKHSDEKLTFFCQMCVVVVCKDCAVADHTHHNYIDLREAFVRFKPDVQALLERTKVKINWLDSSLKEAELMSEQVKLKQQEAIQKVKQIFQSHREALMKREEEVIEQINSIATERLESLSKESESISEVQDSLNSLSSAAEEASKEKNRGQMLVSHFHLSDKLQVCRPYTMNHKPPEDDSFVIKSNTTTAQNALKSLCVFTTAPYPPYCTAMGEGLFHPRVNRLCTVIVCTKDRAKEPCLEGGERLFVQLKSVITGASLPIDIRDNSDGTYSINFRPRNKGDHMLDIAIRGRHIFGSPFKLVIDGGREYGHFGVVTQYFGSEGTQNGQFCRPWGICCDQQGHIIVGDRSNHRVQVFESSGKFKHKFGTEGMRPGQFNRPAGVAVTREGHIVVADKDNHRIQVVKLDGTFLFMFGSKGGNDGQMIYPYDVAVNQLDGRIAVTDTGNHRLLIFSHDGILLGKFGYKGYLCGHFDSPRGIAFNDEGHIIISDFNVHHILVIHPDGTTARILGSQGNGNGQFMRPQGIAVDHMGNFVIADTRNNRIVIMHPSGHFIAKFGTQGQNPGQFDRPTSVAVLPDGRIAVMDFGNSRVQLF